LTSLAYAMGGNQGAAGSTGGFGDWGFMIMMAVIFVIGYFIFRKNIFARKQMQIENRLKIIVNFTPTQQVIGCDGECGIAIDEQQKKICIVYLHSHVIISYKDLLSSELFEDGVTVTKTVRSSQIGGALIGGVLLGGVGAIIGGLSGKTQNSGKVKRIDLRLTVNDTMNPIHDINFLNVETKKNSTNYQQAMQRARHWHGLIEVLIKRAEVEDKETTKGSIPQVQQRQIQQHSIADELRKLADLRDSGVLTTEEFQQQKGKLLGS
jgi:hypothetical protein